MLRSPYTQLYYNRVIKLASLTKQLGATPIFVSQRSFKYFFKDSILYGFDSLFTKNNLQLNGLDYYYLEENLNQTTMKACQDANAICIDFGQYQSFNSHDFYDWVHTTPSGNKKISKILYEELKGNLKTNKSLRYFMVGGTGIEPVTSYMSSKHSNQLS